MENLKGIFFILLHLQCIYSCVLTCESTCLCTGMWRAEVDLPHHAALYLQGQDLLLNPRLIDLASLASQLASGTSCLSLPSKGTTGALPCLPAFMWVSGIQSPGSHLHSKASPTGPSPSPCPPICLFTLVSTYSDVKHSWHSHFFPFPCLFAPFLFLLLYFPTVVGK